MSKSNSKDEGERTKVTTRTFRLKKKKGEVITICL